MVPLSVRDAEVTREVERNDAKELGLLSSHVPGLLKRILPLRFHIHVHSLVAMLSYAFAKLSCPSRAFRPVFHLDIPDGVRSAPDNEVKRTLLIYGLLFEVQA